MRLGRIRRRLAPQSHIPTAVSPRRACRDSPAIFGYAKNSESGPAPANRAAVLRKIIGRSMLRRSQYFGDGCHGTRPAMPTAGTIGGPPIAFTYPSRFRTRPRGATITEILG